MVQNSRPSIQVDLNEFKLHLHLKSRTKLTLHFNSPSRRFYLTVIALVVLEMKKLGKIKSIPLQGHLDLLALLNETVGDSVGSSDKENLLHRIYIKWKDALPNLEEAPLFKVLGKKKEDGDGAIRKAYSFTDEEKDGWANLFEYMGSNENVRLKFAIDKIGVGLNEILIIFGDHSDGDAWNQFISSLKNERKEGSEPPKEKPEIKEEIAVSEPPVIPAPPPQERKISWFSNYRWVSVVVAIGIVTAGIWKIYLSPASIEVASVERMMYPLPDQPSIAVLPFANLSEDPKQEFLCDGFTENITTTLSKIPQLFVIARNSASGYKGKSIDVKKVAENLGVRYILEGSVQKSGEHIRITAQLIDAMSGHHIWSEKYDRDMANLFQLLDEITRCIGVALQIKLTDGEQARVFHRGTKNLEAWALASQAFDVIQRFTREDVARARELSEEAVKLDPQYGFAWSVLAWTYFMEAGWRESPEEYLKKAVELNHKALELNKDLFCATAMLGSIYLWQRQYEKAIAMGRKSIELGPNIALNYPALAITLNYTGNFEEAIKLAERGIRLHPFCTPWYLDTLAMSYRMAGRYEEALALYGKILTRAQTETFYLSAHIGLAEVYSEMGRVDEAHTQGREILRIAPSFSLESWAKTQPFSDAKNLEKRLSALRKAGLK